MDAVFRITFLAFGIFLCFGSGQGVSELHRKIRQAVNVDPSTCVDSPVCSSYNKTVCSQGDVLTIQALCPVTCGLCDCSDAPGIDCASLLPAVCESDIKYNSCPKTCNVCYEENTHRDANCKDQVTDLTCAELEKDGVCNDTLGQITCPKYCGLCGGSTVMPTTIQPTVKVTTPTTTTAAPTTTTTTAAMPTAAQDPCTPNPCLFSGVCSPKLGGGHECQCAPGFHAELNNLCVPDAALATTTKSAPTTTITTTTTTTTAAPASQAGTACTTNPCLNGGTCKPIAGGGFECMCPIGKVPPFCLAGSPSAPATTISSVTSAQSQTCDTSVFNGCEKAEVVFMIEYSRREAGSEDGERIIDHEGDYVKALIDKLNLDSGHVRVGVVVYHDTVAESIHITDFAGDKSGLKARVQVLTGSKNQEGTLHPSGDPNLARALEYVKTNSFTGARPDAKKVVIPIIHRIELSDYTAAGQAATSLKADCVQIFAQAVARPFGESRDTIVKGIATSPSAPYYTYYNRFNDLENAAKNFPLSCSN